MIYITGDMHRDFSRLTYYDFNEEDLLIILGDAGINFFVDKRDTELKEYLNSLNCKMFCIRGNHEERPENISTYQEVDMFGGKVFIEKEFPNLIFAKDGEIYNIDGKSVLVLGGAYSIDKELRIQFGYKWFSDEQLSSDEMANIYEKVKGKHFDVILSHTAPYKYEPREMFIPLPDQDKVDKTMEKFLNQIEENVSYDKWYCGHYHTGKQRDKIEFMYEMIKVFNKDEYMKHNRQYKK